MTYEERKKWLCEQCGKPHQCGYVDRGLTDKCTRISEVMEGWELGYQDAMYKAQDWIADTFKYDGSEDFNGGADDAMTMLIDEFTKYMED